MGLLSARGGLPVPTDQGADTPAEAESLLEWARGELLPRPLLTTNRDTRQTRVTNTHV